MCVRARDMMFAPDGVNTTRSDDVCALGIAHSTDVDAMLVLCTFPEVRQPNERGIHWAATDFVLPAFSFCLIIQGMTTPTFYFFKHGLTEMKC